MALTPEQIQAARAKYGINVPDQEQAAAQSRVKSLDDAWGAAAPEESTISKFAKAAGTAVKDVAVGGAKGLARAIPETIDMANRVGVNTLAAIDPTRTADDIYAEQQASADRLGVKPAIDAVQNQMETNLAYDNNTQAVAGFGAQMVAPFAKSGAKNAIEAVGNAGAKLVEDAPIIGKTAVAGRAAKAAESKQKTVIDMLRETEDMMTPTMKKEAVDQGRQIIKKTATGGTQVDYLPSTQIERAGKILADTIKPKDEANVIVAKLKNAISTRGAQAEKHLEENVQKVTMNEHYDMFAKLKKEAEKTLPASELKAYDEQIKLFEKQLVGRGGYNTANYYKALKEWETNVAETMAKGKEALLLPNGAAKIRAASNIRKAVRDLITSKHPEFSGEMQDISALYEAKDVAIHNASKVKTQTIFDKYPKATKAIGGAGILMGAGGVGRELLGN